MKTGSYRNVFLALGFMLHHFPFFGMRDDQDFAHLEAAGDETRDMYLEVFGEPLDNLTRLFAVTG